MYYKVKVKTAAREFWYNKTFSLDELKDLMNDSEGIKMLELKAVEQSNAEKPNKYETIRQDRYQAWFKVPVSQIIWLRSFVEKKYGNGAQYIESYGLKDETGSLEDGIVSHVFGKGKLKKGFKDIFYVTEYTKCDENECDAHKE